MSFDGSYLPFEDGSLPETNYPHPGPGQVPPSRTGANYPHHASPVVPANYPLDVDEDEDGDGDGDGETSGLGRGRGNATSLRASRGRADAREAVAPIRRKLASGETPDFEVRLPTDRLPSKATRLRALADRLALAFGYQLSLGETRPLPVSGSFAASLVDLDATADAREGRRLLDALVDRGVIRSGPSLPPRGGRPGTRTFEPADRTLGELFALGGSPVEGGPQAVELMVEPVPEVREEPPVNGAVPADGHVGMVATGDGALAAGDVRPGAEIVRHATERTPRLGAREVTIARGFDDWAEHHRARRAAERTVDDLSDEEILAIFPGARFEEEQA